MILFMVLYQIRDARPFHCLWFLASMGQVCWVVFSAWVIGNCTIMNLIYTLLLIDIFAVCCSGSHHEKLGHFQNCLNTRSHSSITCIPLLQNISDRTSTKIHRVKLGQVHIKVHLCIFPFRTVDCQDWMKPVDLAAHPAGKPKFQQNLEEVFVDENAVKELSEDRLKSFEDVYANGVWFLNKGCIA